MTHEARDAAAEMHIALCSSCGCKMDISTMEPYTNVVCPDCGHHTRVKCELGQYLLTGRHAVGGMSKVFKARDLTLDREVAIKILNDDYSQDGQRMKEFEHEAHITAAISHPHVVRVFTVGRAFEHFYIAMEMVSGENLEQMISREGAISEKEILPITAEIISGLEAAKRAGLIHRDMKPGNILFDANGHVKIVDFGLALVTQGGMAKADEIWATPYYVPPEALDGEQEDFRSDMYALGATLYHALSGQPSIPNASKLSQAVRKAKEKIKPLATVAPWLKPETCYLVDRAMALKRDDRFASYAEMEDARASAYRVIEEMGAAEPMQMSERAGRRTKEKVIVRSLLACGLLALLLVIAFVVFKKSKAVGDESGATDNIYAAGGLLWEDDEGSYSPEVAARIGKQFRVSHQMLRDGQYAEAKAVFIKLMNDQQVTEPSASWAGVEAVIATWLNGDNADAGVAIARLRKHMDARGVSQDSGASLLGKQLAGPGIIRQPDIARNAMKIVHMMAVALKNWEAGALEEAAPWFEQIQKQGLHKESPLVVYRDIAKKYLADYRKLKPVSAMPPPADMKEAHERLAMLKTVMEKLATRGRAQVHVEVWQLRLQKEVEKFEKLRQEEEKAQQKKIAIATYDEQRLKFSQLLKTSNFAEASMLLRKARPKTKQQNENDAWIYLAESASAFILKLEQRMADTNISVRLESVAGKIYQKFRAAKGGFLGIEEETGEEVFMAWAKIKPESILECYREAFDLTVDTLEGQRLTEQAVCYAWLMGMQDKAQLAAERLSPVNGNFKKRWAKTMQAHGQQP